MDEQPRADAVTRFYDTHPINEAQILHDLARDGVALEGLSEAILQRYDQDHFGGLEAVDRLADEAGIGPRMHVLDVCSGMGGPARYLAFHRGCRVTGLDLTASRHASAIRLTALVGLGHLVEFRQGNALQRPFADTSFDVVIGQEAFCHVPDKPRLIAECARVVKPGGRIAFTDILRRPELTGSASDRLEREMTFRALESLEGYGALLAANGCHVTVQDDLSDWWTAILVERLAMYRSLEATTVARFGADHFQRWDDTYAFFVSLFARGELGGGRLVARWRA
jgi:ubiquinone/menaquinone biosynthesis C-methylase UbiE